MKKKVMFIAALLAVMSFVSCDSKRCVCYSGTPDGIITESVYTSPDTPCSSYSNATRGCIEEYEVGTIDPGDIAYANGRR